MRSPLRAAVLGVAIALAALASCDGDDVVEPPPDLDAGAGAGVPYDGGAADADGDAPTGLPDAGDGGLPPVLLGITPSPRSDHAGPPTAGDRLDAELTTFAAGVRAVVVTRALRDLTPDAYAALATQAGFYAQHDKRVLFNLALVDRAADGRPAPLDGLPWDDPAVLDATHAAIDALFASLGSNLSYMTFGRDVDAYLAAHPADRGAFEQHSAGACAYAASHPARPAGLGVGVGFSFAAASAPDPSFSALLAAGDAAVLSYLPGLEAGAAAPASAVAGALDAMSALAADKPVVLQAVGYPSDLDAGGSEEKQRLFFESFFDALRPRRAAFPFVNVVELHDPSQADCEAYAALQGEAPGGVFAAFTCSLGLFGQGAADKPAWAEVLGGAAMLVSP